MYLVEDGKIDQVVGVHVGSKEGFNYATLITPDLFWSWIMSWLTTFNWKYGQPPIQLFDIRPERDPIDIQIN